MQGCGSGSGRIRWFCLDPDPDPVFKFLWIRIRIQFLNFSGYGSGSGLNTRIPDPDPRFWIFESFLTDVGSFKMWHFHHTSTLHHLPTTLPTVFLPFTGSATLSVCLCENAWKIFSRWWRKWSTWHQSLKHGAPQRAHQVPQLPPRQSHYWHSIWRGGRISIVWGAWWNYYNPE